MTTLRVLFLEDLDIEARRVLEWLAEEGPHTFLVERVGTVQQAVSRVHEGAADVGLIDLCVPDSKGLETVQALRQAAPHLPLVVQSGLEQEQMAIEALRQGAQDYLVKRHMTGPLVRRALRYAVERAAIEAELREAKERYQLAVDGARDGLWDWDLRTDQVVLSARWQAMLGHAEGDLGSTPEDWFAQVHRDDLGGLQRALAAHREGTSPHVEHEYRCRHKNGSWRWMLTRGVAVRTPDGTPIRMAGSQTDITERKAAERRLVHMAMHDPLTGLPNRSLLLDRLSQAMRRSRRRPEHRFAVLFLDMDRFKLVNDSLGHGVGDGLLNAIAQRLRTCVRPGDTVARLGGDEFAILLEDVVVTGEAIDSVAALVAERIHQSLAEPIRVLEHELYASLSIGVARSDPAYETPEDILRDADIAMYRAKKGGRRDRPGHAVFDKQFRQNAVSRLELETSLRKALDRGEYVVHYQPIIELGTGQAVAFEALVRWAHPTRGLIPPAAFIPTAEETGQICEIGEFVLAQACQDMARMRAMGGASAGLRLSVNLSSQQLTGCDITAHVRQALQLSGLPPEALALELTETAVVDCLERAASRLAGLRNLGVHLHLDDFGAGYSSLGYLRALPMDLLKIDRAFIGGLPGRMEDQAIVRAVLGLAESLHMDVVAEGIETAEQLARLQELECRFGQGYLWGRPQSFERTWATLASTSERVAVC